MIGFWDVTTEEVRYTNMWTSVVYPVGSPDGQNVLAFMATEGSGWDLIRHDGVVTGWTQGMQTEKDLTRFYMFGGKA